MQIESGQHAPKPPSPWAELTGYDRIAFDVMRAIVNDTGAVIPLNVRNDGNIPELSTDDVIEVPCEVGAQRPRPRPVGALPPQVRDLVVAGQGLRAKHDRRGARRWRQDALVDALAAQSARAVARAGVALVNELVS